MEFGAPASRRPRLRIDRLEPGDVLRDLRFNVLQMKSLGELGGGGVGIEKLKDYAGPCVALLAYNYRQPKPSFQLKARIAAIKTLNSSRNGNIVDLKTQ